MWIAAALTMGYAFAQVGQQAVAPLPAKKAPVAAGLWNPGYVITFTGKIIGTMTSTPAGSKNDLVELMVKLKNGGTALVDLGPSRYVNAQRLFLTLHNPITVKGSKVSQRGETWILAESLRYDGSLAYFRHQDGTPFWR